MKRWCHLPSSAQVLVLSWFSVFAVTTPLVLEQVVRDQSMIHATNADLPIPCPEATASWMALLVSTSPSLIFHKMSRCHSSGPISFSRDVFSTPQGKAPITNASGSPETEASQAMN